jgi:hypothetical protein
MPERPIEPPFISAAVAYAADDETIGDSPLIGIELVADYDRRQVFLHCMSCGATFGLHWEPLTVDTILTVAAAHTDCPGETDA